MSTFLDISAYVCVCVIVKCMGKMCNSSIGNVSVIKVRTVAAIPPCIAVCLYLDDDCLSLKK